MNEVMKERNEGVSHWWRIIIRRVSELLLLLEECLHSGLSFLLSFSPL